MWSLSITEYTTDRTWSQEVYLGEGNWTQSYVVEGVTIWADTWDTNSTAWNFTQAGEHHVELLSTIGEDGEDSGDGKTNVILAAGVLSMTLLGYCVFVRHGAEKTNDNFQRA